MAVDNAQTDAQPSMASLVSGIINDAQQLIRQEVTLARREMEEELNKAKAAAISFGMAIPFGVFGALMLCFMVVSLLNLALPPWASFAIVGGVLVLTSVVLFLMAKNKMDKVSLVPRQTVESMKENVQWIKNQT
ncbi:MAG TPA: phage holin family protein [Gemmataceae bacterium]|jgi:uncharacterized protein YacL|nr:phage holin family protein [Gemmataceae bacterium]